MRCRMKITIICVGKIKEKFYTDAINEYRKRLSSYCRLDIIQVDDEKTQKNASGTEMDVVKRKEAKRVLKQIKEDDYVITLEIRGTELDSLQLAEKIKQLEVHGTRNLVFIIGGSLGLHASVSSRADFKLSFSKMTFPHQLMRVILLEQIYRSYRIICGEPYHK